MVFHADFWNGVELPPVRRAPGCRYCRYIVQQTNSPAVADQETAWLGIIGDCRRKLLRPICGYRRALRRKRDRDQNRYGKRIVRTDYQ
jgi:hypothetical protein